MKSWLRQNALVLFVICVYGLTWGLWIPAALTKLSGSLTALGPDQALGQVGRWAPGIVAFLLTAALAGREGLKALFKPLVIWRVRGGWYLLALFLSPAIFLAARGIDLVLGNSYTVVSPLHTVPYPLAVVIPIVIVSSLPGSFAEELGWRGFALPLLQRRTNAVIASVILGLVWGAWHLPSLAYFGQTRILDLTLSILNVIPVAILYTWIYNNTRGSLLLVTLLHVGQQLSNNLLGTIPTWTDDILVWILAVAVIGLYGLSLKKEMKMNALPA